MLFLRDYWRLIAVGIVVAALAALGLYIKSLQWRLENAQEKQAAAEITAKLATDANTKLQESLAIQANAVATIAAVGERREKASAIALAEARKASKTHEEKAKALEAMTGAGCAAVVLAIDEAWVK